jgi:hypothetical protein
LELANEHGTPEARAAEPTVCALQRPTKPLVQHTRLRAPRVLVKISNNADSGAELTSKPEAAIPPGCKTEKKMVLLVFTRLELLAGASAIL